MVPPPLEVQALRAESREADAARAAREQRRLEHRVPAGRLVRERPEARDKRVGGGVGKADAWREGVVGEHNFELEAAAAAELGLLGLRFVCSLVRFGSIFEFVVTYNYQFISICVRSGLSVDLRGPATIASTTPRR